MTGPRPDAPGDREGVADAVGPLCWAATDLGLVRSNNEDGFAVSGSDDAELRLQWQGTLPGRGSWALVADGMGGHAAGEVASALAIATLRREMDGLSTPEEVTAAICRAHAAIHEAMADNEDELREGMGSTIVGFILHGNSAIAFNVGDSRAYHWSAAGLRQISEDHVLGRHMLTQCLGGMRRWPNPRPFVETFDVRRGERLLLCTDGLTDMLFDQEIAELLAGPADHPAEALVAAAVEAGGADNVTAVVIEIA